MSTIIVQASVVRSEQLARRPVCSQLLGSWPTLQGETQRNDVLSPTHQLNLDSCSVLIISVDKSATAIVGWVQGGVVIEFPVNQLSIISPPPGLAPYVRNDGALGSADITIQTVSVR